MFAFAGWLILLSCTLPASAADAPRKFPDLPAIEKWATTSYFGFEKHLYSRGTKAVVAVIGYPTSGMVSSEISVFGKEDDGTYSLVVFRPRLYTFVIVTETEDAIVFSSKVTRNAEPESILILPWRGVAIGIR